MTKLGIIRWSNGGDSLIYRDDTIEVSKFRTFIHTQVKIAQTLLAQLMAIDPIELQVFETPRILLSLLRDRPIESRRDYCYLDYPISQNHCLSSNGDLLLHRLLGSDALRRIFLVDPKRAEVGSGWVQRSVGNYVSKVDRFLEHLLLLVHIISGQPGRSTEVLSMRHRNGTDTERRNIFIDSDGLVHTVTLYSRRHHTAGLPKLIHRYLPRPIGELLVYYQAFILPFRDQLLQLTMDWTKRPEPYLWTSLDPARPGPWEKGRLSAVLKREAKAHLNIKYNVRINRNVILSISRLKQGGTTGGFERPYQTAKENVRDLQATHSSHTAGTIYALNVDAGERWIEAEA